MALQARFKWVVWRDVPLPPSGEYGLVIPITWRVLCGYPNCRGNLGLLDCEEDEEKATGRFVLGLAASYARSAPGVWRIGRHASRRHNHTPRRPRLSKRSSIEHARRSRDGELILPDGSSASLSAMSHHLRLQRLQRERGGYDALDLDLSYSLVEEVALGDTLTIECSRCHALSQFTVRRSADILEEEVKRNASRRAQRA